MLDYALPSFGPKGGIGVPIKNRVKELREDRDWNQGMLAAALEVSRQTVNAIENGRYDPSLPLAFAISDVFGLKIEDIFLAERRNYRVL